MLFLGPLLKKSVQRPALLNAKGLAARLVFVEAVVCSSGNQCLVEKIDRMQERRMEHGWRGCEGRGKWM